MVRIITYSISDPVLVSEDGLVSKKVGKHTSPLDPGKKRTTGAPQWCLNEVIFYILPVDPHESPGSHVVLTCLHSLAHVTHPGGLYSPGRTPFLCPVTQALTSESEQK